MFDVLLAEVLLCLAYLYLLFFKIMHVLVVQFSCFFFFRLTVCLSQGKISRSVGLQKESDVPEPCWHYETTTTVTLKSLIQPLSFLNETKQIKRPLTVPPNQPNNPFNFQQNSTQKTKNTTKPKPFDQMLSKTQRQTTPPQKKIRASVLHCF